MGGTQYCVFRFIKSVKEVVPIFSWQPIFLFVMHQNWSVLFWVCSNFFFRLFQCFNSFLIPKLLQINYSFWLVRFWSTCRPCLVEFERIFLFSYRNTAAAWLCEFRFSFFNLSVRKSYRQVSRHSLLFFYQHEPKLGLAMSLLYLFYNIHSVSPVCSVAAVNDCQFPDCLFVAKQFYHRRLLRITRPHY